MTAQHHSAVSATSMAAASNAQQLTCIEDGLSIIITIAQGQMMNEAYAKRPTQSLFLKHK